MKRATKHRLRQALDTLVEAGEELRQQDPYRGQLLLGITDAIRSLTDGRKKGRHYEIHLPPGSQAALYGRFGSGRTNDVDHIRVAPSDTVLID